VCGKKLPIESLATWPVAQGSCLLDSMVSVSVPVSAAPAPATACCNAIYEK